MKVFVSGASGFIGGAITQALASDHEVVGMARSGTSALIVAHHGGQPVRCSLETVAASDLAGCDAVVHCAAHTADWAPWRTYEAVTVDGTKRMLDAARGAGVSRFLHMSSDSAVFSGGDMPAMNESSPLAVDSRFGYARAKALAEQAVAAANDPAAGFETVSVRPALVWGPGDRTVLPEILEMVNRGAFVWLSAGRSRISTTHIANLTAGVKLALTKSKPGEVLFLVDTETHVLRDFLTSYAAAGGLALDGRSIPAPLARALATVTEKVWHWFAPTRVPPITAFAASILSRDLVVASTKARSTLGFVPPVGFDEGLRLTAAAPSVHQAAMPRDEM